MNTNLQTQLNRAQQAAVSHNSGPAMVLAGAGSGKTTVLTQRVAWLIAEKKVDPNSILLVTFTNKAAGEMRQRVQQLTGMQLPWSGTFHSVAAKILRQYGHLIGLPTGFVIYDSDDQLSLLKIIYKDQQWSPKEYKPTSVLGIISKQKNDLVTPTVFAERAQGRFYQHASIAYQLYQQRLNKMGAVDFDDLLVRTLELFQAHPQVLRQLQQQISHVLVDEYQDTNKAQYQLSVKLAQPQNEIYVVGDFSQSIYAWRGADYRNMLTLANDFPSITEYRLEQNYRSTQTILSAATQVIAPNTSHPILTLWTESQENQPITLFEAEDWKEEARQVVQYISQHYPEVPLSEVAILYRTNAQSRAFEEALVQKGIPYRVVGGVKFYERKEIKDILAYVRLLTNPSDAVSRLRAEKAGKRRLLAFQTWVDESIPTALVKQLEPKPIIDEIITVTHYLDQFDPQDPEDVSRIENIRELLEVAGSFPDLYSFLENVALVQNDTLLDGTTTKPADTVTLMSLHAAKGLEFTVVFMVGMEDGLLPHANSFLDPVQLEEERRLCYVGITRAKKYLYLTYARRRQVFATITNNLRSRFIQDLDSNLLQVTGTNNFPSTTSFTLSRRVVPIDDNDFDSFLAGEMDTETFLAR